MDKCTIRYFLISPQEICYLRFILEGYEGAAVVTTLQPESGLVQLSIAPGCEDDVQRILDFEKSSLGLRPVQI
jgi:hypothetical protein